MIKYQSAEDAIKHIKSHERVFIHGGAATPLALVNALTQRHSELQQIEIVHLHTEGEPTYAKPEYRNSFFVNSFFIFSPYNNNTILLIFLNKKILFLCKMTTSLFF